MVYIPFIYFFILLLFNGVREKSLNLGNFLLFIYGVSALLSVFLYSVEFLQYKNVDIRLSSCIFYCLALTVFFIPFLSKSRSTDRKMLLPDDKIFVLVSVVLITVNLVAILLLVKAIQFVLSCDPAVLRQSGLAKVYGIGIAEAAGMWLLGHFSDFYLLLLVFFFYSKTYMKNKPVFNVLLLLSSMSTIVNGLMSGGRTQIMYWILVFIACFIFFKKDMPRKSKRQIVAVSVFIFSVLTAYIIFVTVFRFENAFSGETDYDEAFSLLDYAGQIFLNFNNFFDNFHHKDYTIARVFPFTYDFLHDPNFDLATYKRSIPMDIGVFSTFLGDLYIDTGLGGIITYAIVYSASAFFILRSRIKGTWKFQQLLLYFLIFQVPLNGIFYYNLYNKTAMISVVGTIIISLLFRFAEKDTMAVAEKETT